MRLDRGLCFSDTFYLLSDCLRDVCCVVMGTISDVLWVDLVEEVKEMEKTSVTIEKTESSDVVPILYRRREYLDEIEADASTTSCQVTGGAVKDYGPDD